MRIAETQYSVFYGVDLDTTINDILPLSMTAHQAILSQICNEYHKYSLPGHSQSVILAIEGGSHNKVAICGDNHLAKLQGHMSVIFSI
jgi:hypothetical protein